MIRDLYDDSHEMYRSSLRTLIEREVLPHYERWEKGGIIDRAVYNVLGDAGFMGLGVAEEHGGIGIDDFRFNAIISEEFCRAGVLNAGLGLINHVDVCLPYFTGLCTDEQAKTWLPGLASGELLAAIAMTEPAAGSDLAGIQTSAVRDGDDFVLNGSKHFISSAMLCDVVIVVCRTGTTDSMHRNLSLLVVEGGMQGFTRGRNLDKVGQHAADTGELFFSDVRVPVANLLGELDQGFFHLVERLPRERLSIAVTATAHAETAFDWTLEYCKQRTAFGQPIATFQNSRFQLASMRTELDIARVFVDRQVQSLADGTLTPEDAAGAKWWCTELNRRVLDTCLQLHGGYGYMDEYPISRAWRDGRAMSIYGGTNEIMKEIIGRRTLGV